MIIDDDVYNVDDKDLVDIARQTRALSATKQRGIVITRTQLAKATEPERIW